MKIAQLCLANAALRRSSAERPTCIQRLRQAPTNTPHDQTNPLTC
jgi:hypothetical protein